MRPKKMVRFTVAVLAGVAASIGAAGPVAASGQPVVEADRQVTASPNPTRLYLSPQIAVDPSDPNTVAEFVGDARNGGCGIEISRDGGETWTTTAQTVMPDDEAFCVQRNFGPAYALKWASNGTMYVGVDGSSPANTPNGAITGLVAVSDDMGLTHQTYVSAVAQPYTSPFPLSNGQPDTGFDQWREPSLAVDPNNPQHLYMGWRLWFSTQGFAGLPERAYVASSTDGGRTWTKPIDILQAAIDNATASKLGIFFTGKSNSATDVPELVVGKDGTVYAFVKVTPQRAPSGQPPNPYPIYMLTSHDGGKTWANKVITPGFPSLGIPDPVIAPNGNMYLVYDSRGNSSTAASNAWFMESTDNGNTWSKPVNLVDPSARNNSNQYMPGISVAPNGRIDVAWYDFRNDPFYTPGPVTGMGSSAGQRYSDVYYTYSTDNGKTWAPNMRLTDRSIDSTIGATFANSDIRGPLGVASANYGAYVTWADSRAAGTTAAAEDAYMTRVRFSAPPGLGRKPASTATKILWAFLGAAVTLLVGGVILNIVARRRPAARSVPATE
ncbi:MAG: sialidase family protein [Acidimicrobiales bacterium]